MGLAAHALAFVILVVVPVVGALRARGLRARGDDVVRTGRYWRGIAVQWSLVAMLAGVASVEPLSPAALGLRAPALGVGSLVAAIAGGAFLAYLLAAVRQADADPELRAGVRDSIGGADVIVPRTADEVRVFRLLAITAGICEELLFRGFLFVYLAAWLDLGATAELAAVVVLSSVLFGAGHAYQGVTGVLKTGAVGLALALVYVATDSLWLPMLLHGGLDLLQGELLVRTFAHDD